jgi:predicted DNA binding CopG/RHH family protein
MKQSRQRTIGINPLELYLSGAQAIVHENSQEQPVAQEVPQESQPVLQHEQHQETRLSPASEVLVAETIQAQEHITKEPDAVLEMPPQIVVEPSPKEIMCQQACANLELEKETEPQVQTTIIEELHAQELKIEDSASSKKQRVTIHIPEELIDKVKNAVYWEPGLTLAGFAEYALARTLEQFEQERGAPFPDRKTRQLRGGRPIK